MVQNNLVVNASFIQYDVNAITFDIQQGIEFFSVLFNKDKLGIALTKTFLSLTRKKEYIVSSFIHH